MDTQEENKHFGFSQEELSRARKVICCFQAAANTDSIETILAEMGEEYNRLEEVSYNRFLAVVNSQTNIHTATWRGIRVKRTPKVVVGGKALKVTQTELDEFEEMEGI